MSTINVIIIQKHFRSEMNYSTLFFRFVYCFWLEMHINCSLLDTWNIGIEVTKDKNQNNETFKKLHNWQSFSNLSVNIDVISLYWKMNFVLLIDQEVPVYDCSSLFCYIGLSFHTFAIHLKLHIFLFGSYIMHLIVQLQQLMLLCLLLMPWLLHAELLTKIKMLFKA